MRILLVALALITTAAALPDDVWEDKYGGDPSITAGKDGISVVLPQGAIQAAGVGAVAELTKQFLERWAPQMCSDVFDFQSAHKGMRVKVALMTQPFPGLKFYKTGNYAQITLDYTPSKKIVCVTQQPHTS